MKKAFIYILIVLVLLVAGFYALNSYIYNEKQGDIGFPADYKNTTYRIDGNMVTLENGVAKTPISDVPGAIITTTYFGNEVRADLDKDGDEDVAFLVTRDGGGSGTFFYLVAALKEVDGYRGSEGVLIGDRIAPQTTEFRDGKVIVNYAERKPTDPMTATPSIAKSLYLKYDPVSMNFGEVVQDFEGEADPSRMTLDMKSWVWVSALYNDGREIIPKQKLAFTLDFLSDGKFSATTDCNRIAGKYVVAGNKITFSDMISTKMFCEGSQESEFAELLSNTSGYHFTGRGQLILDLKFDSGTVTLR